MTTPDNIDSLSNLGIQSATLATLIWFGRRFLAQHDTLIRRLDDVIAESAKSREGMDAARRSFAIGIPNTRRDTKRPRRKGAAIVLALGTLGCAGTLTSCSVDSSYRDADRATYDAVAPAHRMYLESDAALSEAERELSLLVLETWRVRVETAEQNK